MKVCIFGAGAVGTHIGARLCAANHAEVSVIARGASLEAIRANGLTVKSGGEEITGKPMAATDDPSKLPPQDVVLVTLKGHALPALAATFERLTAPNGALVFLLNGIPWWWPHGRAGPQGPLRLLDPEGALWTRLREKALGCIVYSPNEIEKPGVVIHSGGNKYVIGEPSDRKTERVQAVVDLFDKSGLPAEIPGDLRGEIFRKLMGNAPGNTLSALTRRGHYQIATDDPELKGVGMAVMRETLAVAKAMGWDLTKEIDVEKAASRAQPGPGPRPSMLQDVLLGRPVEVESQLGQMQAFAREMGVSVPTIDVLLPLLRGLDRSIRVGHRFSDSEKKGV